MGQRLNIEINYNGEPIANCYYHWSAYTRSAAALVNTILEYYLDEAPSMTTADERLLAAIKMFEQTNSFSFITGGATYAALSEDDFAIISKKFPKISFNTERERNAGIISFTKENMQSTRDAEEGRVTIDIGYNTISFDVMCFYSIDECFEELVADESIEVQDLIDAPTLKNTDELTFDDFHVFCALLQNGDDVFIVNGNEQDYFGLTIE